MYNPTLVRAVPDREQRKGFWQNLKESAGTSLGQLPASLIGEVAQQGAGALREKWTQERQDEFGQAKEQRDAAAAAIAAAKKAQEEEAYANYLKGGFSKEGGEPEPSNLGFGGVRFGGSPQSQEPLALKRPESPVASAPQTLAEQQASSGRRVDGRPGMWTEPAKAPSAEAPARQGGAWSERTKTISTGPSTGPVGAVAAGLWKEGGEAALDEQAHQMRLSRKVGGEYDRWGNAIRTMDKPTTDEGRLAYSRAVDKMLAERMAGPKMSVQHAAAVQGLRPDEGIGSVIGTEGTWNLAKSRPAGGGGGGGGKYDRLIEEELRGLQKQEEIARSQGEPGAADLGRIQSAKMNLASKLSPGHPFRSQILGETPKGIIGPGVPREISGFGAYGTGAITKTALADKQAEQKGLDRAAKVEEASKRLATGALEADQKANLAGANAFYRKAASLMNAGDEAGARQAYQNGDELLDGALGR